MKKLLCYALAALTAALLYPVGAEQTAVPTQKLVRLHVLANSDSEIDQAIKLAVKDRVFALASEVTGEAKNAAEAENLLQGSLPQIEKAANDTLAAFGFGYYAHASLEQYDFPRKNYGLFSLPGGTYHALRVVIGRGEGHNWWCVVFPPLCTAASMEEVASAAEAAGFTPEEIRCITADGGKVQYKLRSVQMIRKLIARLSKQGSV